MIEPEKAEHFHIRMSNESFEAITDLETSWPTFYPAGLDAEEICEEMIGHDHGDGEHEEELDEHVWLSLKNANVLCNAIADTLVRIDGENASVYEGNALSYLDKLNKLDQEYTEAGEKRILMKSSISQVFAM